MKGGNGEGYSAKVGLLNKLQRADPDFAFEYACFGLLAMLERYTYKELKARLADRAWSKVMGAIK